MRSPVALLLALCVVAPAAGDEPSSSTAVWTELPLVAPLAEEPADALWIQPPSASTVQLELDTETPPVVWRVETDAWGRVTALVELFPEDLGGGRYLVWTSPAPRAHLAIVGRAGALRAWLLEPVDDAAAVARLERRLWRWAAHADAPLPSLPAVQGAGALVERLDAGGGGADALRRSLLAGRLPLFDPLTPHLSRARPPADPAEGPVPAGTTVDLSPSAPGLLRLEVAPTLPVGPGPEAVHLDLTVEDDRGPLCRLPTGGLAWPDEPGSPTPTRRRLDLPLVDGDGLLARVEGADVLLSARLYRVRPRFPDLPDAARWARLGSLPRIAAGAAPEPDSALASLVAGRLGEAQERALAVLADDPTDPEALAVLGRAQARAPAVGDRAALAALEAVVRADDREGPHPAPPALRQALRDTWLHATAYVTRGVRAPDPRGEVVQALPARHALATPDEADRHRPGIFSFLPPGVPVEVTLADGSDDSLWTVVHVVGLNLSGRPAAAALQVDQTPAERLVLAGAVTRFRIALAPGARRLTLTLPEGGGERIAVATDLPLPAAEAGRWDGDHPHLRTVQASRVPAAGGDVVFGLPATDTPSHLRVEAWWVGEGAQELEIESAEGRRRFRVLPAEASPAVLMSDGDTAPGTALNSGAAAIDLGIAAEWIRFRRPDGDTPLWIRVSVRGPRHHAIAPPDGSSPGEGPVERADLARISAALADAAEPAERAALHSARAELLLGLDLPAYARRDLAQARELGGDSAALERLEATARSVGGPHRTRVHRPPDGPLLPLDVPAAAGAGAAAWLDDLEADDSARLIADGELEAALDRSPHSAALHGALAARALERAEHDAEAALLALLHASAAREVVEDPDTARIAQRATRATRPDHLGTAEESPDRVLLGGPSPPPDSRGDPAGWARWTMLGAPLPHVDQLLAAGTRWVVQADDQAPAEVTLVVHCDDLRVPRDADPTACHLTLERGDAGPELWAVPRGQVERRSLTWPAETPLAISLAHEGHARYAALALQGADDGWRVADRRAWFHVARPGAEVCYQVAGPTRLQIEAAPRAGEGPVRLEVLDGDAPLLVREWPTVPRAMVTDQRVAYGTVEGAPVDLFAAGPRDLTIRTEGGAVAVRMTHRVASEVILPPPPASVDTEPLAVTPPEGSPPSPVGPDALRLPRPAAGGTVDASVSFWDRWSADLEKSDQRYQYVQVGALHRLGLRGTGRTWFHGGVMTRLGFTAGPSFGLRLGAYHRFDGPDLRLSGRAQGLIQATDQGTFGALALRARLDRPTRLAPDLTLIPHLLLRGYVQPRIELQWFARRLDMELASSYRRAHPFGLGVGSDLVWRPWVDGMFVLTFGAMTNPDLPVLDSAGGEVEFRLYPRPVGLGARVHLSHRFADSWRPDGWWRAELSVGAWADLGPPELWVRPAIQLSYLLEPARLEATVGLSITPGRRAATHFSPADLRFSDLREPVAIDGRWTRY